MRKVAWSLRPRVLSDQTSEAKETSGDNITYMMTKTMKRLGTRCRVSQLQVVFIKLFRTNKMDNIVEVFKLH